MGHSVLIINCDLLDRRIVVAIVGMVGNVDNVNTVCSLHFPGGNFC